MAVLVIRGHGSIHMVAFVITVTLQWFSPTQAGEFNIQECFTDTVSGETEVTFQCPPGRKIVVDEAFLGRSRYGICELTRDDCQSRTNFFHSCDGFNICTKTFKTYSPDCGGDATTLLLSYWCEPITDPSTVSPNNGNVKTSTGYTLSTAKWSTAVQSGQQETEGDGEDVGVVVGCALAAIVTIIMLLIAITMVIRALLQYYKKGKDGEPPGRLVICMDSVCLQVDRLPCFSNNDSNADSNDSHTKGVNKGDGSRNGSIKRFNAKSSTLTNESCQFSVDRMAPVGQECSSNSSTDSGLSEMQNNSNLSSPQQQQHQHHNHHHEIHHSQQKYQQQPSGNEAPASVSREQRSTSAEASNPLTKTRSSKNSSHQTKNCPDKVSTWRQKEVNSAILSEQKDNNNQNVSDKSTTQQDTVSHKPKFDAVAIPNTETGTLC